MKRDVEFCAILDDESDVCFVTERICRERGLQSPHLKLELGTINAIQNISTQRIDDPVAEPKSTERPEGLYFLVTCYLRKIVRLLSSWYYYYYK